MTRTNSGKLFVAEVLLGLLAVLLLRGPMARWPGDVDQLARSNHWPALAALFDRSTAGGAATSVIDADAFRHDHASREPTLWLTSLIN